MTFPSNYTKATQPANEAGFLQENLQQREERRLIVGLLHSLTEVASLVNYK